jgi:hypothetical protein
VLRTRSGHPTHSVPALLAVWPLKRSIARLALDGRGGVGLFSLLESNCKRAHFRGAKGDITQLDILRETIMDLAQLIDSLATLCGRARDWNRVQYAE